MNKIQVFSDTTTFEKIETFIKSMGYTEGFCPEILMETHFFIIDRTSQKYELSNISKRLKARLDAVDDRTWQAKLMEFLAQESYLEYYSGRLRPVIFKKVEQYRIENGLSKSAVMNTLFSMALKNKK